MAWASIHLLTEASEVTVMATIFEGAEVASTLSQDGLQCWFLGWLGGVRREMEGYRVQLKTEWQGSMFLREQEASHGLGQLEYFEFPDTLGLFFFNTWRFFMWFGFRWVNLLFRNMSSLQSENSNRRKQKSLTIHYITHLILIFLEYASFFYRWKYLWKFVKSNIVSWHFWWLVSRVSVCAMNCTHLSTPVKIMYNFLLTSIIFDTHWTNFGLAIIHMLTWVL